MFKLFLAMTTYLLCTEFVSGKVTELSTKAFIFAVMESSLSRLCFYRLGSSLTPVQGESTLGTVSLNGFCFRPNKES